LNAKTIRYYLRNIDGLRQEISDLQADIAEYKAMYVENINVMFDPDPYPRARVPLPVKPDQGEDGLSGSTVSSRKTRHSDYSHVENLVVRRVSFIEKLERELFIKKNLLAAINCVTYYMTPQEKQMFELRYKKHLPWYTIAEKMNYAESYLKERDGWLVKEILSNFKIRIQRAAR